MSRIINTAKVLRRHWKKSTFFFGVLTYGTSYLVERYKTFQMMRAYCEEARKFGEKPLSQMAKPKHVTVILNPEANNKKSNVQFEKFAAPLLHLAGFKVSIFQTEKEKQAQELMEVMSNTDAVLIAGGDGTLHEAVTGLLRRQRAQDENLPLGIVPLGKTNTVAHYLFQSKSSSNAQLMAEAVMAVIRETTIKLDVLKVQYTDETQPVFAMCNFEQGIFADVDPLVQKYWYLGFLKDKFTYFVNSLKDWKGIEIEKLKYVSPCDGCSKCYIPLKSKDTPEFSGRWWQAFVRKTENKGSHSSLYSENHVATRVNENCGKVIELPPAFSNLSVSTASADPTSKKEPGSLWIKIFPKDLSKTQFVSSGLSHRKSKHHDSTGNANIVNAREVILETTRLEEVNPVVSEQIENPTFDAFEKTEQTTFDGLNQAEQIVSDDAYQSEKTVSTVSDETQQHVLSTISDQLELTASLNETNAVPSNHIKSDFQPNELNQVESNGLDQVPTSAEDTVLSQVNSSKTTNENEATSSVQTNDELKDNADKPQYSYIDNEKYRRSSCVISLLPKQVTIYG